MESVSINIKNMVCPRCILAVENIMAQLGVQIKRIELGNVLISIPVNVNLSMIEAELDQVGFELIREKDDVYVERIKVLVLEYLELLEQSKELHVLSDFITKSIGKNYNYLTKIFSQQCHLTIEQFFIKQRLQRVKQLLDQGDLNVTEISYKLCYSSVNYLSSQFKKYTGSSISEYKSQIEELKEVYKEISDCINDIKNQGVVLSFTIEEDKYYCKEKQEYFNRENVSVSERFNYSFKNDKSKKARVSVIETFTKERGIFLELPDQYVNYSKVIL